MLFIVLPAYNEGLGLAKLLPQMIEVLEEQEYRIIVVDDGSKDNTASVAGEYSGAGVTVIGHSGNRGLGEALRTGFLAALQECKESDIIISLDSDNTHPAEIIPEMADKIKSGFELVVASRFAPGGKEVGLSWHRKVLSRGAGWLMRLFFPLDGILDYSCGFRAYRASLLSKAFDYYGSELIESAGFSVSAEILLKLARFEPRCGEVALVLRYDRKEGRSKLPITRTVYGYLSLILRLKRRVHQQAEVEV